MKKRLIIAFAASALLAPANAQTPSPPPQPAPVSPGPPSAPAPTAPADTSSGTQASSEDRLKGFQENQVIDQIDARVAQMKASLRLSEEQNAHWAEFHATIRRLGVADAKRRHLWGERMGLSDRRDGRSPDGGRDGSIDEIDLLRAEANDMAARANDFRQLADAMAPLYRSLDERQQQRLLRFVHRAIETR